MKTSPEHWHEWQIESETYATDEACDVLPADTFADLLSDIALFHDTLREVLSLLSEPGPVRDATREQILAQIEIALKQEEDEDANTD